MRTCLFIIIAISFFSCQSGEFPEQNTETEVKSESILEAIKSLPPNNYYDSINFHIIKSFSETGEKQFECYENRTTQIDSTRAFYSDGRLKSISFATNSSHIPIKKWVYYSNSGKLDSIVDYDKKYPISYFKALEIASQKGIKANCDISLSEIKGKTFWSVVEWNDNTNKGKGFLINVKTGKILKDSMTYIRIHDVIASKNKK